MQRMHAGEREREGGREGGREGWRELVMDGGMEGEKPENYRGEGRERESDHNPTGGRDFEKKRRGGRLGERNGERKGR
jgi:hypothetical protein